MKLIDANKAKEVLKKLLLETALNNTGDFSVMCVDIAMNRIDTWIGLVPTVEAVPVAWILGNERMPKNGIGRNAILDMIEGWRKNE